MAFVVGENVSETELIEHVATELSVHKRPREIRVVESLPRDDPHLTSSLCAIDVEGAPPVLTEPPFGGEHRRPVAVVEPGSVLLHKEPGAILVPLDSSCTRRARLPRCPSEDRGDENAAGLQDSPELEQPRRPVGEMREDRDGADEIESVIAIREAGLRIIDVQANCFRKVVAQPANARLMNVAAGELCASLGVGEKPAEQSARAAAEVEDSLSGPVPVGCQPRQDERVDVSADLVEPVATSLDVDEAARAHTGAHDEVVRRKRADSVHPGQSMSARRSARCTGRPAAISSRDASTLSHTSQSRNPRGLSSST